MMNSQWRAVQSFQESQNLISAINILSIHIKLEMAGRSDLNSAKTVAEAKETLKTFFEELDVIVKRAEKAGTKPLLGVDARRRQFVRNFIDAKRNYGIQSPPLRGKLSDITQLIYSDKKADKQNILLVLEELRMLVEEHIASDVQQLFGGF
ncbi:MAG: hypothetical protein OXC79_10085 [Candidatus Poribacteria bacterium]|nr:hypothetical protein [Candidatus Poribacteria bacterium]